ncbi:hypothetical protein HK101_011197 [Irineochytrium annulatum]|nr:hypothetical protein HK101_011197 [Irineochytrium annulatum]
MPDPRTANMLFGIPLSYISLVTLVVQVRSISWEDGMGAPLTYATHLADLNPPKQNCMLVIVMKYSRKVPEGYPKYLASTAVVSSEVVKLIVCVLVYINEESKTQRVTFGKLMNDLFGKDSDYVKMMVPAALCKYVFQNNLQYLAVANLDPATFQVTYQLKILTTALFSVWMLKKTLTNLKWGSLFLLTTGVALVQLSNDPGTKKKDPAEEEEDDKSSFIGLMALLQLNTRRFHNGHLDGRL